MKTIILCLCLLTLFSCTSEHEPKIRNVFEVTVVGKTHCNQFLIDFKEKDLEMLKHFTNWECVSGCGSVYNGINLDDKFDQAGLVLEVTVQKPEAHDSSICQALYMIYPAVTIVSAKEKNKGSVN
jgi:hypothetical protein